MQRWPALAASGQACDTPFDHRLSFPQLLQCPVSRRNNRSERRTGHKAISKGPQQASSGSGPAVQAYKTARQSFVPESRCRVLQRLTPQADLAPYLCVP